MSWGILPQSGDTPPFPLLVVSDCFGAYFPEKLGGLKATPLAARPFRGGPGGAPRHHQGYLALFLKLAFQVPVTARIGAAPSSGGFTLGKTGS